MSNKTQVQAQFGANKAIAGYASSDIHAKGESLGLLLKLVSPQANWLMLDVATGAGHTAFTFAPHVAQVIATDITAGMLTKTAELAQEKGLNNIETKFADAENLPFDDNQFDLLTCRLAFHHFPNPHQSLSEFARVLKPGGLLGLSDNIVVADKKAASYYNAYEKLRDPSHHWVYPLVRLYAMLEKAGFKQKQTEKLSKEFEFHTWANRQSVSNNNKEKLLAMMKNIPETLNPLFSPRWADNTMYFSLWEAVIVAQKQ